MSFLRLLLFLTLVPVVGTLKILIYQSLSDEPDIKFSGILTDVLVERGHTVDNLLMEWNSNVTSNGTSNARRIIRVRNKHQNENFPLDHSFFQTRKEILCRAFLSNRPMIEELKLEKYDVGLVTMSDSCGFGIFYLIGIPATLAYSLSSQEYNVRELLGIPTPTSFSSDTGDQLTFMQRVKNLCRSLISKSKVTTLNGPIQSLFEEFYSDFPDITDLQRNVTFILINSHEALNVPKPTSSKIKHIGGISMQKPKSSKKFSPDLEKALSRSKRGVVLVSLESQIEINHEIAKSVKHFPQYNFIWKVNDLDENLKIYNQTPNLYMFNSLPQTTILFDSRVKAFITNGDQNSYMGSSMAGVPLILIDQFHDAACVRRNKQGVSLVKSNISESVLVNALEEVLYNPKYEQTSRRLASLIASYPDQPKKTFIEYVELSARFPEIGRHLRLEEVKMNWFVYYSIDVVLFLLFIAIVIVLIAILLLKLPKYLLEEREIKEKEN